MKNTLALLRKELGHGNILKFIENDLGIRYRTFMSQCETGSTPYRLIKLITEKTSIKFEDFEDFAYAENHEQLPMPQAKAKRKAKKRKKTIEESMAALHIEPAKKLSSFLGD